MNRDTIQKLLGGYATGTLTAEEREALFAAALDDQQLFDALAREQSLADLLRDPAARAQVLAALDAPPPKWFHLPGWWRRPAALAVAAMALVAVAGVFVARRHGPAPMTVAQVQLPPAAESPAAQQPEPRAEDQPARRAPPVPERAKKAFQPAPATVAATAPPPPTLPEPPRLRMATAPPEPRVLRAIAPAGVAGGVLPADAITLFYGGALSKQVVGSRFLDQDAAAPAASQQEAKAQTGQQKTAVQARQQIQQGIRAAPSALSRAAAPAALQSPPVHLGVQYRLLRKLPDGEFADADPEQSLDATTPVKFEIVPNDSGYLVITAHASDGTTHQVASTPVERMTPFETPPWTPAQSGRVEFRVWFSRQPPAATGAFQINAGRLDGNLATTLMESMASKSSIVTYVVSRDTAAQSVSFTISLNYR